MDLDSIIEPSNQMLLNSQSSLGLEIADYMSNFDLPFFGIPKLDTQMGGETSDPIQAANMHITPDSLPGTSECLPHDQCPSAISTSDPHWPSLPSRRVSAGEDGQEQSKRLADTHGLSDLPSDVFDEL